jgi:ATP-dependent exoDNAse (exonuclease V) beta subunit
MCRGYGRSLWPRSITPRKVAIRESVAAQWSDGQLASGYIDLAAAEDGRVDIIDFKTRHNPSGGANLS